MKAIRASPHDPLTWLWTIWIAASQFSAHDFEAVLDTYRQVMRMRPGFAPAHFMTAVALAHLGRLTEACETFERGSAQFPNELPRFRQGPPWVRPDDWTLRLEGLQLAMSGKDDRSRRS